MAETGLHRETVEREREKWIVKRKYSEFWARDMKSIYLSIYLRIESTRSVLEVPPVPFSPGF